VHDGANAGDADRGLDAQDRADACDSPSAPADALDLPSTNDAKQPGVDVGVDAARITPGTCAAPIEIPYYASHSDITASTAGASHILDFPCASNGADLVFKVQTREIEVAYADTFGTPWNTALFFTDSCNTPNPPGSTDMAVCNDDACGTSQSQALAVLGYGWHYLLVSGVNGESGDLTLHFQHATIGTGALANLPMGAGLRQGTTSGFDTSGICEASGPKNSYWWAGCPNDTGGSFHASTCKGATWDTALFLQIPKLGTLSCNDDDPTCGTQSTIDSTIAPGAGLYVLTVAAAFADNYGDYNLTYARP
jgi:hypothetical protein